jgi:hypothetical protein
LNTINNKKSIGKNQIPYLGQHFSLDLRCAKYAHLFPTVKKKNQDDDKEKQTEREKKRGNLYIGNHTYIFNSIKFWLNKSSHSSR